MKKNQIALLAIGLTLVVGGILYYTAFTTEKSAQFPTENGGATQEISPNVTLKDGIQYITITAKNGYTPRVTSAQANVPTKLIVKTDNSFDCSVSLVIRQISFQKILTKTGEESIDIGTHQPGEKLQGTCSMGMYSFTVQFN